MWLCQFAYARIYANQIIRPDSLVAAPAYIYEKRYAKTSCGFLSLTTTMEGSSFCFERGILRHTSNHQPLLAYNEMPRPLHPWPMGLSFSLLLAEPEGLEPTTNRLTVYCSTD